MYASSFDYVRPASVAEALQLLAQDANAKALAGGHSLLPAMKLRLAQPGKLVDISRLGDLKGITASGGKLSIGALSTHADIAGSSEVKKHSPALATACGLVGDMHVRNWGTIGGNLAHADPASDPPTVVLACGGMIHVQGSGGKRSVSADNFFVDLFTTDLKPGELITAIEIPDHSGQKSAYVKMSHPASRYAIVGVAVVLEMEGSRCKSARVAVGGATPKATRSPGAENALAGSGLDDAALKKAADALMADIAGSVMGDAHAPAEYRRQMAGVYLKRAVKAALG
jgi:carbon-monoxide dehydrogenase medium subunit